MNQQNETDASLEPENSPREDAAGNFYTGTESFFGVFTQTQVYLSGVRLVHDGKVTQQVSDLASQIESNRRRFLHSGDVNFAMQELGRITSAYYQRVDAWESEANQREQNKKTMSGGALARMKSELSMVRTQTRLAGRMLTKLDVELHQIAGRESFDSKQQRLGVAPGLSPSADSDRQAEKQKPVLSMAEQEAADQCVGEIKLFVEQLVGKSLVIAYEKADRIVTGDPDRVEQVWDNHADTGFPVFLVAGWTVKHPGNPDGKNLERKKLNLCFWLVPKSLSASESLRFVDGRTELWISSRKLDPARITFGIATQDEFPKSDLVSGFLNKFTEKYHDEPVLLVAHMQNLEWTQKTIVVSCSE